MREKIEFRNYQDVISRFKAQASSKQAAFRLISNACALQRREKPLLENIKQIQRSFKRKKPQNTEGVVE